MHDSKDLLVWTSSFVSLHFQYIFFFLKKHGRGAENGIRTRKEKLCRKQVQQVGLSDNHLLLMANFVERSEITLLTPKISTNQNH